MPDRRVAAVVYNPTKADSSALRSLVRAAEESTGWDSSIWLSTTPDDDGQDATRRALAAGVDLVMAAGGDGTVRAVAEVLASHTPQVPLALIPEGTGNLRFGALEQRELIDIAFTGEPRPVDVGRLTIIRPDRSRAHLVFLVMAGIGLDVDMITGTDEAVKKRIGWLAYVGGVVTALRRPTKATFDYEFDGEQAHHSRASAMIVGNCGVLRAGIVLFPDADLSDGRLDLAVFTPRTSAEWWRVIKRVLWHNRRGTGGASGDSAGDSADDPVTFDQGRRLHVHLAEPVDMELDGDWIGPVTDFSAEADAAALLVKTRG